MLRGTVENMINMVFLSIPQRWHGHHTRSTFDHRRWKCSLDLFSHSD
jgi:hypothetical protein